MSQPEIVDLLSRMQSDAPGGFAIGLHVTYQSPAFMFRSYPKAWIDHYTARSFALRDPTVGWGMSNTGHIDWTDLDTPETDPGGVIKSAVEHGLSHGFTIARDDADLRSIGSFSRGDRPFTEEEVARIEADMASLSQAALRVDTLDNATTNRLREMSITFSRSR